MKRKLLALAIPMLLVTGVGCESNDKKVDSKVEAKQEKKTDYKMDLAYLMKDISEQSIVMNDVLMSKKPVEEKKKEFDEVSKELLAISDKAKKLEPGKKYKDVQETMNTGMGLLEESLKLIGDGLELKDRNLMTQGNETVIKASKKITEAHQMLKDMGESY
ncbi:MULTISPECIES: DUF7018 domain-containing (lipo)protein [Bacillus]|uniref:DUF7018 domain-containing (lipo)protein n=1 Tax=Bacillus TaxID=1386 RepID=UPI000468978B|nr:MULTISPECIES: hypothetical protein [Bacillus]MBG9688821.1 tungsten formylmethanofuran dehydrogenase [Bacillus mycoides]PGV50101.1 tungsten formylmethanofuran dehydrogenase [Bacillus cereus]